MKLKNSNCDESKKTQNVITLESLKCDKTKKNLKCEGEKKTKRIEWDKTQNVPNSKTQNETKLKK